MSPAFVVDHMCDRKELQAVKAEKDGKQLVYNVQFRTLGSDSPRREQGFV